MEGTVIHIYRCLLLECTVNYSLLVLEGTVDHRFFVLEVIVDYRLLVFEGTVDHIVGTSTCSDECREIFTKNSSVNQCR